MVKYKYAALNSEKNLWQWNDTKWLWTESGTKKNLTCLNHSIWHQHSAVYMFFCLARYSWRLTKLYREHNHYKLQNLNYYYCWGKCWVFLLRIINNNTTLCGKSKSFNITANIKLLLWHKCIFSSSAFFQHANILLLHSVQTVTIIFLLFVSSLLVNIWREIYHIVESDSTGKQNVMIRGRLKNWKCPLFDIGRMNYRFGAGKTKVFNGI